MHGCVWGDAWSIRMVARGCVCACMCRCVHICTHLVYTMEFLWIFSSLKETQEIKDDPGYKVRIIRLKTCHHWVFTQLSCDFGAGKAWLVPWLAGKEGTEAEPSRAMAGSSAHPMDALGVPRSAGLCCTRQLQQHEQLCWASLVVLTRVAGA